MNLGSPDSTEVKAVRRYLNEFLMDPRVIDTPFLWRWLLVKGIITPLRAPRSAKAYSAVWTDEGSPLMVLSRHLQQAFQQRVEEPVVLAMRYGSPDPNMAFEQLLKLQPALEEVVLVPLYPHYAMSSYETAVEYARAIYRKNAYSFRLTIVTPFYDQQDYLNALTESVRPFLQEPYDHLLFSYHGIPERHVRKTDPTGKHCLQSDACCTGSAEAHAFCYRHQCISSTNKVAAALQVPNHKFSYSFQSRLGRDEWLKPYTAKRLQEMPGEGIRKLVILCPAFISDCLETLEEIAVEGRELFLHAGGESFTLVPCLNLQPKWLDALEVLVRNAAS